MRAITDLEELGYTFALDGENIVYTHDGDNPDPAQVRPFLEYAKRHKAEAVRFLQEQATSEAKAEALLARLEAAWELVRPSGLAEDDDGAIITFLALEAQYRKAQERQPAA